ncbi:MAG: phosphatase PAP2 family protein [Candidatus Cybelea sp.]
MSIVSRSAVLFALLVALFVPAGASASPLFYYLDPRQIDLTALLPPPPDVSSAQERADEEQVAAAVMRRSPAQLYHAEEDSMRTVFFFSKSIGPGFDSARLPLTTRFFSHVRSDVEHLIDQAKTYWERPRPSGAHKARGSYPSGHAAFAAATAILLSQVMPSKRDAIFGQARMFAENRILLGVHYPSDVAAGWTAGTIAAYAMMHDRAFQHDFADVDAELHRASL